MKPLMLTVLSACAVCAQVRQVSVGNNSPNIDHVTGSVTINYSCVVEGPFKNPFTTSSYYLGADYPSSILKATDPTGGKFLSFPPHDFAGPATGGLIFDSLSFAKVQAGTGSIIVGTDYLSSLKSVTDLAITNALGDPTSIVTSSLPWFKDSSTAPVLPMIIGLDKTLAPWSPKGSDTSNRFVITGSASIDYTFSAAKNVGYSTGADSTLGAYLKGSIITGTESFQLVKGLGAPGSATPDSASPIFSGTDYHSMSKNLIDLTGARTSSPIFTGASTGGGVALDWSSLGKTAAAGTTINSGYLSPVKGLGDLALMAAPASSIVAGTDNESLSKSIADLTARGKIIIGWTIAYRTQELR